jgi:hypothetical protein
MKKIGLILFYILSLFLLKIKAQNDTVYLMNGHMVCGEITDTSGNTVTAFDCKRPGKQLKYESDEVFSFKKKNQEERFFYQEQPDNPNWFNRKDFKYYMQAERDARSLYKSPGAFWSGIGLGFAGGATGSLIGVTAPFISLGITQLFKIKIKKKFISNSDYLGESAYIDGYERQARTKRSFISLKGGLLGLGLGYATYFISDGAYLKK